ncbi:MAG TPA: DUF4082 domain-containing protein [Caulobacter sp.]|nr:DUF4082 domain-containing protein [Caulobacter sp.]
MQQFTVNMFADMGIQPGVADSILQAQGLLRAVASNDHVAATASLDDLPASVGALSTITISGMAADLDSDPLNDDGKVAIVEVSVDGGSTWRLAQGTTNWTYSWTPTTQGVYTIMARAIDDSLNTWPLDQLASDIVTVTAAPPPSSYSLFGPAVMPSGQSFNDGQPVELGVRFRAAQAGVITALRYFRAEGDAGDADQRQGHLWSSSGTLLGAANFDALPGQSGWQVATLLPPVAIQANATYTASYKTADNYLAAAAYFTNAVADPFGMLTAPASAQVDGNGVYAYGAGLAFPDQSFGAANYWIDVVFALPSVQNSPPVFTSNPTFSRLENGALVGTLSASDPDGNPLAYAIAGGADQALFSVDPTTGALRFLTSPDFEAPQDAGADNSYQVSVSVSDGIAPAVQQAVTVTVTDLDEPPPGPPTFEGRSIRAQYVFGATANALFPMASASQIADVAAGTVEFANLPTPDPSAIGNGQYGLATVDLGAQTIQIQFPLDPEVFSQVFVPFASVQDRPFNGVRLSDADGQLPAIISVSIVSQRGFTNATGAATPLTAADIAVTSDSIFLNVAGKGRLVDADPATVGVQPSQVVLLVTFDEPSAEAQARPLVAADLDA